jgi:deoxyribonuclease I
MRWNFLFVLVFTISQIAYARITNKTDYYGKETLAQIEAGQLENRRLLDSLHKLVSKNHNSVGYDKARMVMFGKIHLEQLPNGTYTVKDVYCEKYFTDADFKDSGNIGPNLIPGNGSILNTEHTWPQSRFTGRFNRDIQKSDLHHLYPTDSEMNGRRSSLHFGEVVKDMEKLKCPQNRLGSQGSGGAVFEPPVAHRGNVARAIFYFATRYQMKVGGAEEIALRRWHKEDPVDAAEELRNDQVEDVQGNRNPYIDHPEFVDHIQAFTFDTSMK